MEHVPSMFRVEGSGWCVMCSFCICTSLVTETDGSCSTEDGSSISARNFDICLHCCTFVSPQVTVIKSHFSENP